MWLIKNDLDRQIELFVDYVKRRPDRSYIADQYYEWLRVFRMFTRKTTVFDIIDEDVGLYASWVRNRYLTDYQYTNALKALRLFLRHYNCDTILNEIMKPQKKVGNPIKKDLAIEVQTYRTGDNPPTYREIKRMMDERHKKSFDLKSIYRWAKYKL